MASAVIFARFNGVARRAGAAWRRWRQRSVQPSLGSAAAVVTLTGKRPSRLPHPRARRRRAHGEGVARRGLSVRECHFCGEQVPRGAVAGASLGFCSLVVEPTILAAPSTTSARRLTPARPQDIQLALREAQRRDLFAHPKDQLQAPPCRELRQVPQTLPELLQRTATSSACSRSSWRGRRATPRSSPSAWT